MLKNSYDIVVVGAGLSGCVLAERYANLGKTVLIIDKRNCIGGNCHDYIDDNGIIISKYGPHFFHTNDDRVWRYVSKFVKWLKFEPIMLSVVDGKKVPIPVNIDTVNLLFQENLQTEKEMSTWLKREVSETTNPKNSEEAALRRVGSRLYKKMFLNYTLKQWGKNPKELMPEIMDRIPVHLNHENHYFTDKYQAVPDGGYNNFFKKILDNKNITVALDTNWIDIKGKIKFKDKMFFSGRIDEFFDYSQGALEYRSLKFEQEKIDRESFQDVAQENYPSLEFPFTRIVEYKKIYPVVCPYTIITKEYPTADGEPYYPVLSENNLRLSKEYFLKSQELPFKNIYFVGRLGSYKYLNMDQAIKNSLNLFERLEPDQYD